MTTYTEIPDADVDQDSPITQPLITLLRDNPISIAEGDATAPRVEWKAVRQPTVGTTYTLVQGKETEASTGSNSASFYHDVQILCADGQATFVVDLRGDGGSGVGVVEFRLNGVTQATLSNATGTYGEYAAGLSVTVGDRVAAHYYRSGSSGTAYIKNFRVKSDTKTIVAVPRGDIV